MAFRLSFINTNELQELPANYKDVFAALLNENLCEQHTIKYCEETQEKVFRSGLLGFTSYLISEARLVISAYSDRSKFNIESAKPFFKGSRLVDRIIASYSFRDLREILLGLLKNMHEEGINSIQSTLLVIFAIGGLGSTLILVVFLVNLFVKV